MLFWRILSLPPPPTFTRKATSLNLTTNDLLDPTREKLVGFSSLVKLLHLCQWLRFIYFDPIDSSHCLLSSLYLDRIPHYSHFFSYTESSSRFLTPKRSRRPPPGELKWAPTECGLRALILRSLGLLLLCPRQVFPYLFCLPPKSWNHTFQEQTYSSRQHFLRDQTLCRHFHWILQIDRVLLCVWCF